MKQFLNVARAYLVTSLFIIPVFAVFSTTGVAEGVRLKDKYPPSWYQILPADKRFVLVMNDEAVLDKETGLVWERSPDTSKLNWYDAITVLVVDKIVGGRKGWRLPTYEELATLVDPSQQNPSLPPGHLFLNVQYSNTDYYWSATTVYSAPSIARYVEFQHGHIISIDKYQETMVSGLAWCVRGGYGYNN